MKDKTIITSGRGDFGGVSPVTITSREHWAEIFGGSPADAPESLAVSPDFDITYIDVTFSGTLIPNAQPSRTTWRLVDREYLKVHTCEQLRQSSRKGWYEEIR